MSWTWDPTAVGTSSLQLVRQLIGDTDTNDQQYADETINGLLTRFPDPFQTAMVAAQGLVSFYSRRVSLAIDGFRIDLEQRVANYKEVVAGLRMITKDIGQTTGAPLVAGVSIGEMSSVDANTDRPPSHFQIGMTTAPGVMVPQSPDGMFPYYWPAGGP